MQKCTRYKNAEMYQVQKSEYVPGIKQLNCTWHHSPPLPPLINLPHDPFPYSMTWPKLFDGFHAFREIMPDPYTGCVLIG
jgi:hypothetical protein